MRIALSIAASDPTGGAGLQADLQVFRAFGVHGAGVVTALTVQDTTKVHSLHPVFPSVLLDQLRVVLADVTPHAIKIGALASDDIVRNVQLGIAALAVDAPIVLDPILFSSSGAALLESRAWGALTQLFERCALVTPNLPEAEALTGRDCQTHRGTEDAARHFMNEFGAGAVLVKGGHRDGAIADLLAAPDAAGKPTFTWLEQDRLEVGPVHGTGCALSSAIAARLAIGDPLGEAVAAGRAFVADAIAKSHAAGSGARFLVLS